MKRVEYREGSYEATQQMRCGSQSSKSETVRSSQIFSFFFIKLFLKSTIIFFIKGFIKRLLLNYNIISRGGLEVVPAQSHKLNYVGSTPTPATI